MSDAKIQVKIDKQGKVHVEVNGCSDNSCEALTNALTAGLGSVEQRDYKPEYELERPDYIENLDGNNGE